MCSRDWRLRTQDILTAIAAIQRRTAGMTWAEFESDETILRAVLFDFIVIGEATRNIPISIQNLVPQLPWRQMGDMRNLIAHESFQVDPQIVWDGIQNALSPLIAPLQQLLEAESIDP